MHVVMLTSFVMFFVLDFFLRKETQSRCGRRGGGISRPLPCVSVYVCVRVCACVHPLFCDVLLIS